VRCALSIPTQSAVEGLRGAPKKLPLAAVQRRETLAIDL
jgi:hypothetical protein